MSCHWTVCHFWKLCVTALLAPEHLFLWEFWLSRLESVLVIQIVLIIQILLVGGLMRSLFFKGLRRFVVLMVQWRSPAKRILFYLRMIDPLWRFCRLCIYFIFNLNSSLIFMSLLIFLVWLRLVNFWWIFIGNVWNNRRISLLFAFCFGIGWIFSDFQLSLFLRELLIRVWVSHLLFFYVWVFSFYLFIEILDVVIRNDWAWVWHVLLDFWLFRLVERMLWNFFFLVYCLLNFFITQFLSCLW